MLAAAVAAAVGVALGLSLAAPPGPMNAIIAEESVLRGWTAGFAAGLGAMTADAAFFALAYLGVVAFVESAPTLHAVMVGAGGVLMLYFAYGTARDASGGLPGVAATDSGAAADGAATDGSGGEASEASQSSSDQRSDGGSKGFTKAFAFALTNPYQIVWWLTAGVGLLHPTSVEVLGRTLSTGGGPVTVAGFFAGILLWITGFPATLVAAGERVDRFGPAVAWLSALALAGFGVSFLASAVGALA
jgi:threonine/homoserine/homoserine lactone efflux protein